MSRYRNVHVKIWTSADFLALSAPKPNGRDLFLHLLTGPHTNAIPGLFSSGPAALAESIGWPAAAWKRCFQEIEARGMVVADWSARLVYLPGALAHNRPTNPNIVRSWRDEWTLLPSCPLKTQAASEFGATMSGAFAEAWATVVTGQKGTIPGGFAQGQPEPSTEPSADCSADTSGQPLSRTHACARSAPAPVPDSDPALRSGEGSGEVTWPDVEPSHPSALLTALRVDWARAHQGRGGRGLLTSQPPNNPEENGALESLWADAKAGGIAWKRYPASLRSMLDSWAESVEPRFLSDRPVSLAKWLTRERTRTEREQQAATHDGRVPSITRIGAR